MLAVFKREIKSFFSSSMGYLVIGFFLLLSGLFLWVFKGPFNILEYGFADLSNFFLLAPWVFLFLIPAITMKSFSEEKKLGTLELLFIKPISLWQTVCGKFLGAVLLTVLALIPTLLYVYAISALGTSVGNLDTGLIWGSYFGLLFLISCYVAIGLFASSLTDNQIVAFMVSLVLSFVFYYGFEALSTIFSVGSTAIFIQNLGMKAHFESIARGAMDTRDLIYFLSISTFFLYLTVVLLKNHKR